MDRDAPLRKNLPGTWIETNEQAVRPTVTIDTSLKKLVIERNRTYHESHVSSTSTGEKLIWSVAGSYHGNWNVKNSVLQLEISSADNPLLFLGVATGLLGHYYRISQITETTLILEDLGSFAGETEVLRRLTLQRL